MPGAPWSTVEEDALGSDNTNMSVASQALPTASSTEDAEVTGLPAGADTNAIQVAINPATFTSGTTTASVLTKLPNTSVDSELLGVPAVRDGRSGTVDVGPGGTFDLDRPALLDNDVLIAVIGKEDDFAVTPPAGWTEISTLIENAGQDMFAGAWYRVVSDASSEPSSYTFTNTDTGGTDDKTWWIASIDNVDTANPIEAANDWEYIENTNPDPATAAALTTTNPNSLVLAAWFVDNDSDVTPPSAPWNTELEDNSNNGHNLNISSQLLATAGSSGGADLDGVDSGDEVMAIQFALRSAGPDFSSIVDLDLYAQHVIVRHQNDGPLTIDDIAGYDTTDDSDLRFSAATGTPDTFTVLGSNGLYVWDDDTFAPNGVLTLTGEGDDNPIDGSLYIGPNATLTATNGETVSVGG